MMERVMGAKLSRKTPDLSYEGKRFGRLTVLTWVPTHSRRPYWLCECDCGERRMVCQDYLKPGGTRSCGCLRTEPYAFKHGGKGTRLYSVWRAMKKRCYQVSAINYHNYGGRGIVMCDEWRDDFGSFKVWAMGNGYEEGLSIDRIDNDGIYEPSNCRWATRLENNLNRRNTKRIVVHGEELFVSQAAAKYGVRYDLLKSRLLRGYTPEEAVMKGNDPLGRISRGLAAIQNAKKALPPRSKADV